MVHWNPIFQLILNSGWWKRFLVNYKPFAFIQSFFLLVDTIHKIKWRPIFKEEQYSCSLKPFSWIFANIPASGSSFFWLVEEEFSSYLSSRLVYMKFGLISNRVLLFRGFFLLLESITEIRCNSFLRFFQFLAVEAVFPVSGNGFSIECYLLQLVETDFFFLVFYYSEQISC